MLAENLSLVRCQAGDAAFVYDVIEQTLSGYVVELWGPWHAKDELNRSRALAGDENCRLIRSRAEPVGVLLVNRDEAHIQLEQLLILPAHQGKGIGTSLLNELIAEATADSRPIKLRVLRPNPARGFYSALGFTVVDATKERYFMEFNPDKNA